jgi:hypothetical protein
MVPTFSRGHHGRPAPATLPGPHGLSADATKPGDQPSYSEIHPLKTLLASASLALLAFPLLAPAQSAELPDSPGFSSSSVTTFVAPEPAASGAAYGRDNVVASGSWRLEPFSRVGVGADISPLGIGIQGAIDINHFFDARVSTSFFGYTTPDFNISGFNGTANLHLASFSTIIDWYPFGSILRVSPGIMLYNGNQITGSTQVAPGSSFSFENVTYYGAATNSVPGATPLAGTMKLGLNTNKPSFLVTAGFGSYVPRSQHHWSLPTEIGVAFTGAPTVNVNFTGWACTNVKLTNCSNVADTSNEVGRQFNSDLNLKLGQWRRDVQDVIVYPIIRTAVVYSFNIR